MSSKTIIMVVSAGPDYSPSEYQLDKIKEVEAAILATPTSDIRNLLTEYSILLQTKNIFTDTFNPSCEHQTHQVD